MIPDVFGRIEGSLQTFQSEKILLIQKHCAKKKVLREAYNCSTRYPGRQ